MIIWQLLGRFHTLTEKRKAKKLKPIRTRGKTEADKRNVLPITITASYDWLLLFRFPFFHQGMNPALVTIWTTIISSNNLNTHFLLSFQVII